MMKLVNANEVKEVSIEQLHNQKTVLFFYPKANTPGWVVEATDFSGLKSEFLARGYQLIGVSRDSVKAQQNFIAKRELTIDLIADVDSELCTYFEVLKEKNMFGKSYIGIERSTFVLDENFQIIKEYRKIKVAGHAKEVLENLN